MSEKLLKRLETAGPAVVFAVASLLHFLYDLNPNVLTALFGAVNESIWEHIKIFSLAYLAYGFGELLWAKPRLKSFTVAKAAGAAAQGVFIPLAYYSYTFFTGKELLAVDLIIGFLSSVIGFWVSCRLYSFELDRFFLTALMLLFLILMMLLCFTFFPPETELFRDAVTGEYGVLPREIDMGAFALETMKNTDLL